MSFNFVICCRLIIVEFIRNINKIKGYKFNNLSSASEHQNIYLTLQRFYAIHSIKNLKQK